MSRPKKPQTSAEIEAEIRRLEEEKQRAVVVEDQRRGELLRGFLHGKDGDAIRAALRRAVSARDAYLFDVASAPTARDEGAD